MSTIDRMKTNGIKNNENKNILNYLHDNNINYYNLNNKKQLHND
jgi:hypothetical protein